jgi:hypothetical protein
MKSAQNLGEFTVSITVLLWLRFILATINVQFDLHGGTYSAIYLVKKDHDGLRTNNPIVENSQIRDLQSTHHIGVIPFSR